MRKWLLPALLLGAVGVLVWVVFLNEGTTQPEPVADQSDSLNDDQLAAIPLQMTWRNGNAQRYRISSNSSMQMQATVSGASSIQVDMTALLDVLILDVNADEVLTGMQLADVELLINHIMDADVNAALATPFRVRFATSGMPLKFEFPEGVSEEHRSLLENLIRSFQVSLDNEHATADSWQVLESNGSGTYQAEYRRTGAASLEKSKRSFVVAAPGGFNWSSIQSSERITIDDSHDWLTEMTVEETLRSDGQGGPAMTVSNHASLHLQAGAQLALAHDRWDFIAAQGSQSGARIDKPVPRISAAEARRRILQTVPELDNTKRGRLALIHRLRDLLRVDDSLPAVILEILQTQQLSDRTRADLYLALELTGNDSAQAALVSVVTDSSWSLRDGMRAIVALAGIKQPTAESLATLWQTAQNGFGGDRQQMASSAAFALGSIGSAMHRADNPDYASLRSDLLSNAGSSGDAYQRSVYITALGNTQDPALANDVAAFLNDPEPTVRRAAALSLGSLDTDQVADTLVSHYRAEDNMYVRGAITESLQSWTQPTDAAMSMFRQSIRTEVDEGVRYHLALLLAKNLKAFPENEPVLRNIMRTERSKRIREKVAEALATQHSIP